LHKRIDNVFVTKVVNICYKNNIYSMAVFNGICPAPAQANTMGFVIVTDFYVAKPVFETQFLQGFDTVG